MMMVTFGGIERHQTEESTYLPLTIQHDSQRNVFWTLVYPAMNRVAIQLNESFERPMFDPGADVPGFDPLIRRA